MTFEELKERVRNLSFYDTSEFTENLDLFISSTNKAIKEINSEVEALKTNFDITQDGSGGYSYYIYVDGTLTQQTGTATTDTIRYDLETLTKNASGKTTFARLTKEKPDIEVDGDIYKFGDFKKILDHTVVVDSTIEGTISFYYELRVQRIYDTFGDDNTLPIDYNVEHLLPLLTTYYFLQDDDAELARTYYNQYDSAKQEYISARDSQDNATATIRTDLNTEGA